MELLLVGGDWGEGCVSSEFISEGLVVWKARAAGAAEVALEEAAHPLTARHGSAVLGEVEEGCTGFLDLRTIVDPTAAEDHGDLFPVRGSISTAHRWTRYHVDGGKQSNCAQS